MDKEILDMINGAIVYASILSGVEFIKDECNKNIKCSDCKFLNEEDHFCMFLGTPDMWDLDNIERGLKK